MQRRAAAIFAALLILIAAGAYTMMVFAQAPTITLDNPDYELTQGDTFTIQDRTYRVAAVEAGTGSLEWIQQGVTFTDTWENESTVTLDGTDFTVNTHSSESPASVELIEVRSVGDNVTTTEIDGETHVVITEGDEYRVISKDQFLRDVYGPPKIHWYSVGDAVSYNEESTTVTQVTNTTVTLEWTGPDTNSVRLDEGTVVTLNGQEFVPHFTSDSQVSLTTDIQSYEQQVDRIDTFDERISGLMGVTILSGFFAFIIVVISFIPSRY